MIINKIILFTALILSINFSFGQSNESISEVISDCDGAMNILEPGTYSIQFTGKSGVVDDIINYPSLKLIPETNSIWCSFIAPYNGKLYFEAIMKEADFQMLIFEKSAENHCKEITNGLSEIKRSILNPTSREIGLSKNTNDNFLYPLEMKQGQSIKIYFNTIPKLLSKLRLNLHFEANETNSVAEIKIVDKREDDFSHFINVKVRDASNGKPVISNFTIEGIKDITALYSGSDFFFTLSRSGNLKIKCDAQGYFFADRLEKVSMDQDYEMTIWLEPLGQGKSMQIEEIEFYPGTSEFLPSAESKLRRLKDFLALNSEIRIEIQGHVFAIGENSFAAQKLSEARAKKVLNYLSENGINKERMTSIGYGNTKPIYEKPKFAYEEQANRRVEIKVIK